MSDPSGTLIGVVILARHGDREGFFQDPLTYTASATSITPLGNAQEFQLGQLFRSMYLNESSPTFIKGMSTGLFDQTQVLVRADSGGERGVIFDSSISVVQGLWPATTTSNTTLANGTTVVGPLGGYQYVPIESVEPDEDISLEGYTDCNTFNDATAAFYNSTAFKQVAAEAAPFLNSLPPFLDGRAVTLVNMWNIFDYINVQSIHNKTFLDALPPTYLEQARALGNYHEYGVFSSPQVDGIGNIAGRAILPSILSGFDHIVNASDPLKFVYEAISYKPFISLFNMTGVAQTNPELAGVVEYAAAVTLEVRQPASGEPLIRFNFKNGTTDTFHTFNILGQNGDTPLSVFQSKLAFAAINTTAEWCPICANTQDRGCGTCDNPALVSNATTSAMHRTVSPVAAGFIGAGVTIALFLLALASLAFLGFLTVGKKTRAHRRSPASSIDEKLARG